MSGLPPLPGHPGAVRLLADRLAATAQRLSALAGVLARLRDGATWEGPAGEAFAARLREHGPVLDAVAARLGGAAAPLRLLADAMEEAQAVVASAVLDVDDAEHAYLVLEGRAAALLGAGGAEHDPGVMVAAPPAGRAGRGATGGPRPPRGGRRALPGRRPAVRGACCAACPSTASPTPCPTACSRVPAAAGHDVATLAPVATVVPELKPVVVVADAVATAADAALLAVYGEGDAGQLAVAAGVGAAGALGGALRFGATAGATRTTTGVVSTARLTTRQRVALGVAAEARARRDALRAAFRVPPSRGTPSALLGGPAPRSLSHAGWRVGGGAGVSAPVLLGRMAAGARRTSAVAQRAARERVDRAFLDDWRLATANGPRAQRMYASGATLEVAATAAARGGAGRPEGGGSVR